MATVRPLAEHGGGTGGGHPGPVHAWVTLAAVAAALCLTLAGCGTRVPKTPASTPVSRPDTSTASGLAEAMFGTFASVDTTGRGDGIARVPEGVTAALVTAINEGEGDFAVEAVNSDDEPTALLVNHIGTYEGTTMYALSQTPAHLRITANGPWKITVSPVASAKAAGTSIEASGDAAFLYDGPIRSWRVWYGGHFPFTLTFVTAQQTGTALDQQAGPVNGVVKGAGGPAVIVVSTYGPWRMIAK